MKRREFLKTTGAASAAITLNPLIAAAAKSSRPNIVWILAEDMCPDLSCYGNKAVHTPNLDKMAAEGIRYTNAFTTAPVCSASRSALMTGMHQNFIGAHQHRTKDGFEKKSLPSPVRPLPDILRDAGYFTCLMPGKKLDLNFIHDKNKLFDGGDWSEAGDKPFFAQMSISNTHRGWGRDTERPIDIKDVKVPPYYPDTPLVRRDIANGLEEIQKMDRTVGKILERLEKEGLADNTMVVFIGDHGRCQVRGKQFLYDSGLYIPLIVRWPKGIKPGQVSDDLISGIDITATIIGAATGRVPEYMHGRNFLDPATPPRDAVFAARDKMDKTHDSMRAVRTKRYKYILNLMPERAWCQLNEYKERSYPVLAQLNVMHAKGQLNKAQVHFMQSVKPEEELYDIVNDPYEVKNLAGEKEAKPALNDLRKKLSAWRKKIADEGPTEEFRKGGWSSQYPTRTLEEWEVKLAQWEAKLFPGKAPAAPLDKKKDRSAKRAARKKKK